MSRIPLRWAESCRRKISGTARAGKLLSLWPVLVWVAVWYILSEMIGQEILLASPVSVFKKLVELAVTGDFWRRVLSSYLRVMLGLALGATGGILLGVLASASKTFHTLMKPLVGFMRAVPVASFIILALVWLDKQNLGTFIAVIVCLPVFWSAAIEGINSADRQLVEMSGVFRLGFLSRVRVIYLPSLCPFIKVAFETTIGLAWKSGIAAELIAVPAGSVGEMLYYAKVWLATDEMLAWTFTAVILSALTAKAAGRLLEGWARMYE